MARSPGSALSCLLLQVTINLSFLSHGVLSCCNRVTKRAGGRRASLRALLSCVLPKHCLKTRRGYHVKWCIQPADHHIAH